MDVPASNITMTDGLGWAGSLSMSPSIKELATALIAAQTDLAPVSKDKANPFFNSKYAGLAVVMPAALRVLTAHDLGLVQTVGRDATGATILTTMLMHTSGEWLCDSQQLLLDKDNSQGQGSAITYGRRYALMSMLGMVAEEDDDGNAAPRTPTAAAKPERRPARTPPRPSTPAAPKIAQQQIKALRASLKELWPKDEPGQTAFIAEYQPLALRDADGINEVHLGALTKSQGSALLDALNSERRHREEQVEAAAEGPTDPREAFIEWGTKQKLNTLPKLCKYLGIPTDGDDPLEAGWLEKARAGGMTDDESLALARGAISDVLTEAISQEKSGTTAPLAAALATVNPVGRLEATLADLGSHREPPMDAKPGPAAPVPEE